MTQQTQHNPDAMWPALEAKLRQFADGLTSEEQTQLRALPTDDVTGMLSPSLRDKAQRAADALTPEEQTHLHLLLERAGVGGAAASEETDTRGYMKPLYENDLGYKGRPGGTGEPAGGSGTPAGILITGAAWVVAFGVPK